MADSLETRDDRFLIPLITISFAIVLLNFILGLELPALVSAVFLATAVSALVYRFLGGIGAGASFELGLFRLGGSLAALVGCAYFFNAQLASQARPDVHELFEPRIDRWVALDRDTGLPLSLSVHGYEEPIPPPPGDPLRMLDLDVTEAGVVAPAGQPGFSLGRLQSSDLAVLQVSQELGHEIDDFAVSGRLAASSRPYRLDPLDLSIRTGEFRGDFTWYTILDIAGNVIHDGRIKRRAAQTFPFEDGFLLVAVIEVRHDAADVADNYAKFAVGRIALESEIKFAE